ncbi:MAG TPA: MarR family transcriptional regulator [Rhizomicrobium sp.]|jgi:DNA-binding MarR family transcriptional regulator|nr:MarR family transcriptional regulator [Rhizomicrobium sp.]
MTDLPFAATLEVRDACLCMHVQRAARALARHFDEAFRPLNLTNGQFSLLMSLNRPEPAPMSAVAGFLAMDRTTLTAALKPLVRRKLIRVMADPKDARARLLALTLSGKKLLARAVPIWRAHHGALEKALGRPPAALKGELIQLSKAG